MTEKNMVKADFYTSIVLIAFGITITVMAWDMPLIKEPYSSPGVLPEILGFVITGLALYMFIRSIIRSRGQVGVKVTSLKAVLSELGNRRMAITAALSILYSIFFGIIPFALLSIIYIFVFIVIFEYDRKIPFRPQVKKIVMAAIIAVFSSASITVVFQYLFLVRLP